VGRAPNQKHPVPGGFTGHGAPYPSGADIQTWLMGPESAFNIGLRLHAGVIGLDVDAYVKAGKQRPGGETLAALEAAYGPLPPTWITGARDDGVSGIRLFRVPLELDGRPINWPGEAGKGIEIVQHGHRYAIVWPSTNPEAGGALYRWQHPTRSISNLGAPPPIGELPHLPEAWVRGLALPYDRTEKASLEQAGLHEWWRALRPGPPCPVVHTLCAKTVDGLRDPDSSRHELARDAVAALARLGGEGHHGAGDAILAVGQMFEIAVGAERVASGEWARLLNGAVKIAATDHPTPQQHCQHDAATRIEAPEGFSTPEGGTVFAAPTAETPPGALTLPEHFWSARPSLSRIRQAAHSRVRSGDVVFYGLLCRIAAMAPHTLRAKTDIGEASLNLFAAIVGPSGTGKSSGLSVSRDLVKQSAGMEEYPLGSGEGMAEAFMGEADVPTGDMAKDGSAKVKRVRQQVRHNALFHSDEGASLNKLIERAGSTIGETLRTAWSGESLGQKNGRAETTRVIPARSYSAGLIIGYQLDTVLPLLADVAAGTPQRFLFAWAVDPTIPGRGNKVDWPGEIPSPFPDEVPTDAPAPGEVVPAPTPRDLTPITFAQSILDELYDLEHAKSSGALPDDHPLMHPFRSQHNVLKVKVSAGLALMEGRRHVTDDGPGSDWALAQIVIDTSDAVVAYLRQREAVKRGKARAAALAAEAEAETHRAEARAGVAAALDATAERRLAARVATWVHEGGPATPGALRKRCASRDRAMVEAAVELAVGAAWLVYGDDAKIHPGPSRPSV
jgi:hypothetical protein